jgi:hypothetical protein
MCSPQSSSVVEAGCQELQAKSGKWSTAITSIALHVLKDDTVDFRLHTRSDVAGVPEWSGTICFGGLELHSTPSPR